MPNLLVNNNLLELGNIDTPSITNIVGSNKRSYPNCLNIYDEWTDNWYTDQSIRCMYPELGPTVGYLSHAHLACQNAMGLVILSWMWLMP